MNINAFESTDRRLVFELTGHKLNLDGKFEEIEDSKGWEASKIDPTIDI